MCRRFRNSIPTLKAAVKIVGSAADAEKMRMWQPNAQAGPSASTACGQAEGGRPMAIRPPIQDVPFTRGISQSLEHALPTNG